MWGSYGPPRLSDFMFIGFASHNFCGAAGVILHPTSLPGPYGSGEIGSEAFHFVDWLVSAGMQVNAAYW